MDGLHMMNFPTTEKISRADKDKGAWWTDLLKYQIDQGYPVLYRGDKCDLCSDKHYWVIAGYNADGLFYCNWGWNGKSHLNGFYLIRDLYVNGTNYMKNNTMLYNIVPDWNVTNKCELSSIEKGNDEELRVFCGTAVLDDIVLKGNSQSKIAFTQELIIDGPLTITDDATLVLMCCDKERNEYLARTKTLSKEEVLDDDEGSQAVKVVENIGSDIIMRLTPNPAKDDFRIDILSFEFSLKKKDVHIFNNEGRLCRYSQFDGNQCFVSLNGFETGLYYVRVSSEGISVTEKIIVL